MKRILFLTAVLIVIGSIAYAETPSEKIIGSWNMVRIVDGEHQIDLPLGNPDLFASWKFNNDGTGQIVMGKNGEKSDIAFAWRYEEGGLRISGVNDGSTDVVAVTFDDKGTTLTLSKSETDVVVLVRNNDQ